MSRSELVSLWEMRKVESIEEFYKRKSIQLPDNLHNGIGHFNVFKLDPYVGANAKPIPYARRDFYKISLTVGSGKVHFADKIYEVQKQAMTFSNPRYHISGNIQIILPADSFASSPRISFISLET